mgnify:FL=1
MKRLLTYLKPHRAAMLLVTVLVLLLTALELYKPIVIGDAIDDYIEGYNVPYLQVQETEPGAVCLRGDYWKRVDADSMPEDGSYAGIVLYNDRYYVITGLQAQEWEALSKAGAEELRAAV